MTLIFLSIKPALIISLVVLLLLIIYYVISYYIYTMIMLKYNTPPVDLVNHEEDFYKESFSWYQEIPKEDVYVTSYDNFKLHAVYIPSYNKKSNNVALIVHGYQSKATDMIIIGKMYSEMGFQVVLTDLRGHGESEGYFTSFGHYEKFDIKKWLNFILRTYGTDSNILIHGVSMGASATMLATGLDIPINNVKFLLLDSGFTYVKKTFLNTKKSQGLKLFFFGLNIVSYIKHKFLFYQIRPIKYMKKNTIPFLIVQGDQDTAVTVDMAQALYNVSPATQKELLIVKDSKHALGFRDDYQLCYDTLLKEIKDIFNIKKIYDTK
ncbi:alpha/beta hydrolase [Mycoplasmatota bacterium WC30]